MSASILIIHTPDKCIDCPICASYQESAFSARDYWCCVKNKDIDPNTKPDWCPLETVPEKHRVVLMRV